jgi:hypothetical protein
MMVDGRYSSGTNSKLAVANNTMAQGDTLTDAINRRTQCHRTVSPAPAQITDARSQRAGDLRAA